MILYHGSNVAIDQVDLSKSRPFKDFGRAFYLSADEQQAWERAYAAYARLSDPATKLYYQSAGYVYSLLEEEITTMIPSSRSTAYRC